MASTYLYELKIVDPDSKSAFSRQKLISSHQNIKLIIKNTGMMPFPKNTFIINPDEDYITFDPVNINNEEELPANASKEIVLSLKGNGPEDEIELGKYDISTTLQIENNKIPYECSISITLINEISFKIENNITLHIPKNIFFANKTDNLKLTLKNNSNVNIPKNTFLAINDYDTSIISFKAVRLNKENEIKPNESVVIQVKPELNSITDKAKLNDYDDYYIELKLKNLSEKFISNIEKIHIKLDCLITDEDKTSCEFLNDNKEVTFNLEIEQHQFPKTNLEIINNGSIPWPEKVYLVHDKPEKEENYFIKCDKILIDFNGRKTIRPFEKVKITFKVKLMSDNVMKQKGAIDTQLKLHLEDEAGNMIGKNYGFKKCFIFLDTEPD